MMTSFKQPAFFMRYSTNQQRADSIDDQRKYIGEWVWGSTRHLKDENGKRVRFAANPADVIQVTSSQLIIVERDLWDKVQERLEASKAHFGPKPGQKPRGSRKHYTEQYPS